MQVILKVLKKNIYIYINNKIDYICNFEKLYTKYTKKFISNKM